MQGRTIGESKAEERGDEDVKKVEKCPWAAEPRTGRPKGLGGKRVDLLRTEGSSWDPRATFLGDHREAKGSKGVNPQLPNFREAGSGATNDCIVDVCQDVCREVGKVGFVA